MLTRLAPACPSIGLGKRRVALQRSAQRPLGGTAAEYIALSADLVTELPDHVSLAEGATLGVPAMTAHRSVFVAGTAKRSLM
jgi:NADPH:quinone reductase